MNDFVLKNPHNLEVGQEIDIKITSGLDVTIPVVATINGDEIDFEQNENGDFRGINVAIINQ